MAEAVILLVLKKIGVALGTEAIKQSASYFNTFVTQLTQLQGSMGRVRTELRLMLEFLSRMDVRNRKNRMYEIWVEEMRVQVHVIEDIVDDYLHLIGHKPDTGWGTYLKKGLKRPNVLISLNRIASSINDAEANLVHLFQAKRRWVSMADEGDTNGEGSSYIVESSQHLANISRSLSEEDLVGVDGNRKRLSDWLLGRVETTTTPNQPTSAQTQAETATTPNQPTPTSAQAQAETTTTPNQPTSAQAQAETITTPNQLTSAQVQAETTTTPNQPTLAQTQAETATAPNQPTPTSAQAQAETATTTNQPTSAQTQAETTTTPNQPTSAQDQAETATSTPSQSTLAQAQDSQGLGPPQLVGDEMERKVIVLYGMGGLGKTTLAANVYKNNKKNFQCHAWVNISQTYSIKDVLKCLINQLYGQAIIHTRNIDNMDTGHLQAELRDFLMVRKYLIVLDDVWTLEAVHELLGTFASNQKGSRVVVTTRVRDVAARASQGRTITLEKLSDEKSRELFNKTIFLKDKCPQNLIGVSNDIVERCKGVPLAIVSIGKLLFVRDKSEVVFRRIYKQLDWEISNNPSLEPIRNILNFSYIYLPAHLKSCFLYCGLFPEGYHFRRKRVVRWWIAEGFVQERGGNIMEEVAEGYLQELVEMGMLQVVKSNSFGRIKTFTVHDMKRELAVNLCRRECFGVAYSAKDRHGESAEEIDEPRMVIHNLDGDIVEAISGARHLRSVIALDKKMSLSFIPDNTRYMSVLELSGLPIDKVPDAIGNLFNLRHLGLRGSKVKLLPRSIEKLSHLLTLDLFESEIHELPRGIVKLKKLRHLFVGEVKDRYGRELRWCNGVRIPKSLEEKLRELQTMITMEAYDEGSVRILGEMRQMRSLRVCNVKRDYCKALYESLRRMEFLTCLDIIASDEGEILELNDLNPLPPNLQKLRLRGRLAQIGMLAVAEGQKHLRSVDLSWSRLEESPLPSLSRFSSLTDLNLTRAYHGHKLVFRQGWFPKLDKLTLRDMPNLRQLDIQQGAIEKLKRLVLVNLIGMIDIPRDIEHLSLSLLSFLEITRDFLEAARQWERTSGMPFRYTIREEGNL